MSISTYHNKQPRIYQLTECNQIEERNPSGRGQEVLSKGHTQGRNDPGDLLHRQETILDVGL